MIHHMTKIPVFYKDKVTKIYTVSEDYTNSVSLLELFELYLCFYSKSYQAINQYLKHLEVFDDFYISPTKSEIKVLISQKSNVTRKHIASSLNASISTINTHIENLCIVICYPY
jgi:DNA-binding CsgD family transcriptional regulator